MTEPITQCSRCRKVLGRGTWLKLLPGAKEPAPGRFTRGTCPDCAHALELCNAIVQRVTFMAGRQTSKGQLQALRRLWMALGVTIEGQQSMQEVEDAAG